MESEEEEEEETYTDHMTNQDVINDQTDMFDQAYEDVDVVDQDHNSLEEVTTDTASTHNDDLVSENIEENFSFDAVSSEEILVPKSSSSDLNIDEEYQIFHENDTPLISKGESDKAIINDVFISKSLGTDKESSNILDLSEAAQMDTREMFCSEPALESLQSDSDLLQDILLEILQKIYQK